MLSMLRMMCLSFYVGWFVDRCCDCMVVLVVYAYTCVYVLYTHVVVDVNVVVGVDVVDDYGVVVAVHVICCCCCADIAYIAIAVVVCCFGYAMVVCLLYRSRWLRLFRLCWYACWCCWQ